MTPTVCFVDDDPDEVRRFRRYLGGRFLVGAGTSLAAALEDLRAQGPNVPDIFALDLYFPRGEPNTPEEREELAGAWARFLEAKAGLLAVLERLRQSPDGGFALARQIAELFPGIPVSFFTRKGTLEDAIEAFELGAASIVKKPDPDPDLLSVGATAEAYDAAFERDLPKVVRGIERALGLPTRPQAE
jgi:CheY-like chemotaxis protein